MATLYIMKCNKKQSYKLGMTATSAENRRQSIQNSIRREFGNEYLVNVCYVKEIENTLMCSLIEWQIQHYLQLKGYQRKWNGFTVKSNGSSEWFYLPKGIKQLKKYIALEKTLQILWSSEGKKLSVVFLGFLPALGFPPCFWQPENFGSVFC